MTIESRVTQQISHRIEDASVVDRVPGLNWRSPEALCDVALVDTGCLYLQDATTLANELAGGQLVDMLATDGCIELPIEILQCLLITEAGGTGATPQRRPRRTASSSSRISPKKSAWLQRAAMVS